MREELNSMRRDPSSNYWEIIKLLHDYPVKNGVGNCGENANVAYYHVQVAIRSENMVSIAIVAMVEDHVFVVIGVDPHKQLTDPECWPKTAVICDPWAEVIYPAVLYKDLIKEVIARVWFSSIDNIKLNELPERAFFATNTYTPPAKIPEGLSPADLRKIDAALAIHQKFTTPESHTPDLLEQYKQCI